MADFRLGRGVLEIVADSGGLRGEVSRATREAGAGQSIDIPVRADTSALWRDLDGRLRDARGRFARAGRDSGGAFGTAAGREAGSSLGRAFSRLDFLPSITPAMGLLASAIAPVTAGAMALGSSLGLAASSAAAVLPAMVGLGGAIGTVGLAFTNLEASGAGRALSATLQQLEGDVGRLRVTAQQAMLPGVTSALQNLRGLLPQINTYVRDLGTAFGEAARQLGEWTTTPLFRSQLQNILNENTAAARSFAGSAQPIASILMSIAEAAAPLVSRFAVAWEQGARNIAQWIEMQRQSGALARFFQLAGDELAKWWNILKNFGVGIVALFRDAAPAGMAFSSAIESVSERFRGWATSEQARASVERLMRFVVGIDAGQLAAVAVAVGSLGLAMRGMSAAQGVVGVVATLAGLGPVGLVIGGVTLAVGALAAGLGYLYATSQPVRDAINQIGQSFMENFAGPINDVRNAIGAAVPVIRDVLLVVIRDVSAWITDHLFPALREAYDTALPAFREAWNRIVSTFQENRGELQQLYDRFTTVVNWLTDVAGPILGTWASLWAAQWSVAISMAINAFGLLNQTISAIVGVVQATASAIANAWNALSTSTMTIWNGITTAVTTAVNAIVTVATNAWTAISASTTTIWNAISTFFVATWAAIQGAVTAAVGAVQTFVTNAWTAISASTMTIWNAISTFFGTTWTAIQGIFTTALTGVQTTLGNAWTAIQSRATSAWNAISTFFRTTWTAIQGIFTTALTAIRSALDSAWTAIQSRATSAWNAISTFFRTTWTAIQGIFTTALTAIRSALDSAWTAIQSRATSAWNAFRDNITNTWNTIRDNIGRAVDSISSRLNTAWGTIRDQASRGWNAVLSALRGPVNSIASGIEEFINTLADALNGLGNSINSVLPGDPLPTGIEHIHITRMATGGPVSGPGTGTSDSIPIMVSDGEYILRSRAVRALQRAHGSHFLDQLNQYDVRGDASATSIQAIPAQRRPVAGFQAGGQVSAVQQFIRSTDPLPYVWGGVGPNGYDCIAAGVLITTDRGDVPIEQVTTDDLVLTRAGWRRVLRAWKVRDGAETVTVHVNGESLIGTPDHRVWTENRGWVPLGDLTTFDTVVSCQKQPFGSSRGSRTTSTQTHTTHLTGTISSVRDDSFTAPSGSRSMAKSLTAMRSTTSTMTRSTTIRATSTASQSENIAPSQPHRGEFMSSSARYAEPHSELSETDGPLDASAPRSTSRSSTTMPGRLLHPSQHLDGPPTTSAPCAVSSSPEPCEPEVRTDSALPSTGESSTTQRHDVYDLTVEGEHEFFAAGVLVHNCSGLVGEVWNRLTGHSSYARRFTTANVVSAGGFRSGHGAYTIGLSPSHVVGNLSGLAFEARGRQAGILVGGAARSVDSMPNQYYLPQVGGRFVGGGGGGSSGPSLTEIITGMLGPAISRVRGALPTIGEPWNTVMQGLTTRILDAVRTFALSRAAAVGAAATPVGGTAAAGANSVLGRTLAAQRGWTGAQWTALYNLWQRESNWNHLARNPSSGAYGIPQALPGSRMASAGSDWQTNPETQIRWGLGYIAGRYGTPSAAWAHSQSTGWYDGGGPLPPGPTLALNGTGRTEQVLSPEQIDKLAQATPGGGASYNFEAGSITLDASKVRDIQQLIEAINEITTTARQYGAEV